MTRNVTIRMDEELLRAARHRAVDEHLSTSQWIAHTLEKATRADCDSRGRKQRALDRLEHGFHLGGTPLTREQTHGR